MDTASKLPFFLQINHHNCVYFADKEELIYAAQFPAIQIVENEEVTIYFNSSDRSARLYLDALDILPDGKDVMVDEDGRIYHSVSDTPFPLYKHNDDYDALRVDTFRLCIKCADMEFYSLLEVLPKQRSIQEWTIMRNDLEAEIRGLAQDIVRRNIGLGDEKAGTIPPQKLYTFFVMQKYAGKVLAALIDLQKAPKYHIITNYVEEERSKAIKMDSVTVRKYLHRGGSESKLFIPTKQVTYDIQENRLLKRIVAIYDQELMQFIKTVEGIVAYRQNSSKWEHRQYRMLYEQGLQEFLDTAKKLKRITAIIKSQDWFSSVGPLREGAIPHAFALDSRYGVLYKMYEDLKHPDFKIQLDPNYSYSWKKSSSLYEMWCYVKICRAFAQKYQLQGEQWDLCFGNDLLFPYLSNGVTMSFENDDVQVDVIFDQFIPTKPHKSKMHDHPFYTVGRHTRPDITIDVYSRKHGWYIGSIILECKYRKLSSFWQGNTSWSSRPQIQAYYTDAKSEYTYDGLGGLLDVRPVQSVIVLTPDLTGDGTAAPNINTLIRSLRPDISNGMIDLVMESVEACIAERLNKCRLVERWKLR